MVRKIAENYDLNIDPWGQLNSRRMGNQNKVSKKKVSMSGPGDGVV
jgi:hypothetical protein